MGDAEVTGFSPDKPHDWIGRKVRGSDPGEAVVLAVDDTEYAPSAWIKYSFRPDGGPREYPSYRSIDLSDLEDVETGEGGPRWGTKVAGAITAP